MVLAYVPVAVCDSTGKTATLLARPITSTVPSREARVYCSRSLVFDPSILSSVQEPCVGHGATHTGLGLPASIN